MVEMQERKTVTAELKEVQIQSEAATATDEQLTEQMPTEVIEETFKRSHGVQPTAERLEEINKDVKVLRAAPKINTEQLKKLESQRLLLEKMQRRGTLKPKLDASTVRLPTFPVR